VEVEIGYQEFFQFCKNHARERKIKGKTQMSSGSSDLDLISASN